MESSRQPGPITFRSSPWKTFKRCQSLLQTRFFSIYLSRTISPLRYRREGRDTITIYISEINSFRLKYVKWVSENSPCFYFRFKRPISFERITSFVARSSRFVFISSFFKEEEIRLFCSNSLELIEPSVCTGAFGRGWREEFWNILSDEKWSARNRIHLVFSVLRSALRSPLLLERHYQVANETRKFLKSLCPAGNKGRAPSRIMDNRRAPWFSITEK